MGAKLILILSSDAGRTFLKDSPTTFCGGHCSCVMVSIHFERMSRGQAAHHI